MTKYYEFLEKLKGNVVPFPNDSWDEVSDIPTGVPIIGEDGKVYQAGKKTCTFIDQNSIPHYFCDSVSGSDSNDGLTDATPKQTVSAVVALATDSCVFEFARGSYFREQLTVPFDNSVVKVYGTGERPIFDCADVVNTFTKTGGQTNVWQFTYDNELGGAVKSKISLWFDQTRMIRTDSLTECDSTLGSFYAVISETGTDTVYFHNTTSTDPNSDGFVYDVSVRQYGVNANTNTPNTEVYSIYTKRNGHNDGSLIGGKYLYDCYAYDGTVHNIWVDGIAEYCTAEMIEMGSSTMFISYAGGVEDKTYRYTNCHAINDTRLGYGWGYNTQGRGFFCHTSGGGVEIAHILFEGCSVKGIASGFAINDTNIGVAYDCIAENCIGYYGAFTHVITSKGYPNRFDGSNEFATNRILSGEKDYDNQFIKGSAFSTNANASGGLIYEPKATDYLLEGTDFVNEDGRTNHVFYINNDTEQTLTLSKNIISGSKGKFIWTRSVANVTIYSDLNSFGIADNCSGAILDVSYSNLTEWQALDSQDLNSITGDPLYTGDPLKGDFSIDPSSPANTIGAGSTNYVVTAQDLQYMNVLNPV